MNLHVIADGSRILSVCPELGKQHALIFDGFCPLHLQNPYGKELYVSCDLHPPYFMLSPIRGSDILIIKILGKKFKFIPKFIYESGEEQTTQSVSALLDFQTIQ